jgi:WD40 repeat protein
MVAGCADQIVRVWDITTREEVIRFKGHMGFAHAVAVSPDGRWVLSGGADKTVRFWDMVSGKELQRYNGHKKAVKSLAFSPDGTLAVSGSDDGEIRVWRLPRTADLGAQQTGKPPAAAPTINEVDLVRSFTGHTAAVTSLAFSPDGRQIVSGSKDLTVRLWKRDSDKELLRLESPNLGPVTSVAVTDDGERIVFV